MSRSREIRVGLVVLVALAVLAGGIFLIGDRRNVFSSKNRYYIDLLTVGGLKSGNPVQLNGVDVGTVQSVVLPEDPAIEQIRVWIEVDAKYGERIRAPRRTEAGPGEARLPDDASQARIKTLGLLGDKYIEITSGSPRFPIIPSEGEIPSAQPTDVDKLIASGEDVMDNVVEISASLSEILARMERGEGLLGDLTMDSPSGRRLRESLVGASEGLERIAQKVETGEGPLPRLIGDRAMADQLARSLDRFEGILASVEQGEGLLPGLLKDPTTRQRFDETLATLQQVAQDLQSFTADLESSDALLPRLVKDEQYGREITEEVRQIVDRLSAVSEQLTRGEGTAAKLIYDPQVYEAINDILVGVNESRILRWLLRNRQQKGIEKRYDERVEEMEGQGVEPPPLDDLPEAHDVRPPLRPPARPNPEVNPEVNPETSPEIEPDESTVEPPSPAEPLGRTTP
jgi:phospholipid/cholesterol/gamma-HCH transport system substrate-binding protein